MNNQELIDCLSQNVKAVTPLPRTFRRTLNILVTMVVGSCFVFMFYSHRHDLPEALTTVQFVITLVALAVGWLISGYSLALLQLPTVETKKYLISGLSLVSFLLLCYCAAAATHGGVRLGLSLAGGLPCSIHICFLSILPFVALFFVAKQGAPVDATVAGLNLGFCCAALGSLLLSFSCPSENPTHLLLWHVIVPFAAFSIFGALLGRRILKW